MQNQELGFWFGTAIGTLVFILLMVWSLVWKGIALYKAARNTDKVWYIVLLIVNSLGILEILYIYVFSKKKKPCC